MPTDPRRIKELFVAAIDLVDPAARAGMLDRECAGDSELRQRLDALLAAHDQPNPAVEQPLAAPLAEATGAYVGSLPKAADEKVGALIAGKYKLLQLIGEGGMGAVFMADQLEPVKRRVAIKLIRSGMDSKAVLARFEAERQALALMDHPNIAKVLDAGTTGEPGTSGTDGSGKPYFVMELVKGTPINEFCDQHKLGIGERLSLFMQVCSAVQHAHQKGIIHRDLKPSNILVESHDGKPLPKVIDFGLAKAMSGQPLTEHTLFTQLGTIAGTPLYMAPEQAAFNAIDVDTRADIYALGVVLYEMLTGTTPIERTQLKKAALDEILRVIRESEPPTPSKRLSTTETQPSVAANRQMEPAKLGRFLRGDLDWIVMKALSKERDRRYETANGFAKDIERFLNHEPVTAGPPTASYRLRKFVQRNKGPVLVATVIALCLVGGIIGTGTGLVWAVRERDAKEQARQDAQAAAEAAKKASSEAQIREAETKAVLNFVDDKIFAAARPVGSGGLGPEVTLRQAIDMAQPFVEGGLTGQPLIEARLRMTLGSLASHLGDGKTARVHYEAALSLFIQHRGRNHPDTLRSMVGIARSNLLDQRGESLRAYQEVLELQKAHLGVNHPDTLLSMQGMATAYNLLGRTTEAIALLNETLERQRVCIGSDHYDTLHTLQTLCTCYSRSDRTKDAIKLGEELLARFNAKFGPSHPATLMAVHGLAIFYFDAGRIADATKLFESALPLMKLKFGPHHPDTLRCMYNLGNVYLRSGRNTEGLTLLEESLSLRKTWLGSDHLEVDWHLNKMAAYYDKLHRSADALKARQELCRIREERLALLKTQTGHENGSWLWPMRLLAEAYEELGRHSDARRLREEELRFREKALAWQKASQGAEHPDTLFVMREVADCYQYVGRHADALELRKELLLAHKAKLGPTHSDTLACTRGVIVSLFMLERPAEAMAIVHDTFELLAGRSANSKPFEEVLAVGMNQFRKRSNSAGCRQIAEEWEKLNSSDAIYYYNAACWRAITAAVIRLDPQIPDADKPRLAKPEADQAMLWLKKALATGYQNVFNLQSDHDLDELRPRADFTRLLADLALRNPP